MTNARDKANIPVLNFQSKGIDDNADATAITIDSSERVGIGTASPLTILHVQQSAVSNAPSRTSALYLENNANCEIQFVGNSSNDCQIRFGTSSNSFKGAIEYELDNNNFEFYTNGSERMRIPSGGGLLIGKTSSGIATAGFEVSSGGDFSATKSGSTIAQFNRLTNDGDVVRIKKDGTTKHVFTTTALGVNTSSPSATLDVNGTVKATGFDGSTPMVYAQGNSGTSCADNTFTKITLDNEIIDTQGLFANSRFTVTSGYEGKYLIIWQISFNHTSTAKTVIGGIYKNGSIIAYGQGFSAKSSNHTMIERTSIITDLTTNDYIEFYGRHDTGSTKSNNSGIYTNASITKLID